MTAIAREPQPSVRDEMMVRALDGSLTVAAAHAARTEKKIRGQVDNEDKFSKSYVSTAQKFMKNIATIKTSARKLTDAEISILQQSRDAINDILSTIK